MKLELIVGNASRPVILDNQNYEGTIMEEPISNGLKIFNRVLKYGLKFSRAAGKKDDISEFEADWSFKIKNNVIAFLGDRGSGKTSCMLSVENIIRSENPQKEDILFMDVIDPSFFDESHNILQLFIAQLYHLFHKCSQKELEKDMRRKYEIVEVTKKFLDLQKNLKYLDKKIDGEVFNDGVEVHLDTLASGVYLQSNIRKVVAETLRYFNKKVLVIAIDDLDLNVARAYEMMEQIRKYLVMPEIIILLSAKVDQLKRSVELSLNHTYKALGESMKNRIPQMSERYMTKFMPLANRVYMVLPQVMMTAELILKEDENKELSRFQSVAGGVLDLIFQKTRYLFYNIDGNFSYIIPRNLRNLTMLIELLVELQPFNTDVRITTSGDKKAIQNAKNKSRFKNYIFSDCLNNIDDNDVPVIESLAAESDMATFNKEVVEKLTVKYRDLLFGQGDSASPQKESANKEVANIIATEANTFNLSIGDVMELLEYISNKSIESNNRNFLFLIKAIYSIKLYECYDRMTDTWNSEPVHTALPLTIKNENTDESDGLMAFPGLIDNKFLEVPDYIKLTGGNFFSFDRIHLLQKARDFRLLNGNFINRKIKALVNEYEQALNRANENKKEIDLRPQFIDEVRLMEFFVLCAAFHVNIRDKKISSMKKEYRRLSVPYYLKTLSAVNNIVFDILKPFFSTIHPALAYQLFDIRFYNMCLELNINEEQSILRDLLYKYRKYGSDNKRSIYSDLASRTAIRNMEILSNLYSHLRNRANSISIDTKGAGLPGIYKELLGYAGKKYRVKTYALNSDSNDYRVIDFKALQPLHDILDKVISCDPRINSNSKEDKNYEPVTLWEIFQYSFVEEDRDEFPPLPILSPKPKVVSEPLTPERGTLEYKFFTKGYIYNTNRIRGIIFNHYPEYKDEYGLEGPIRPLLRTPYLYTMTGYEVVKYLASITTPTRSFADTFSPELLKVYNDLIGF